MKEEENILFVSVEKDNLPPTIIGKNPTIRLPIVIYSGNIIGDNFQTGHYVLIREANKIGNNVSIGTSSVIEHHVIIGDGVRIHSKVFVPEYSVLEDKVWIGPGVVLTNAKYPNNSETKHNLKGPLIKSGAIIGAGAVILPGVTIGEGALVGAGSVVTKDVEAGLVVAGNPAKVVGKVKKLRYPEGRTAYE